MSRDQWAGVALVSVAAGLLIAPRWTDLDSYPNPWDQDEAVFLVTARAVRDGSPLYQPTFCAQPPVHPATLILGFRLLGDSVETGRLVTLLFGCVGVLAAAWIAGRLAGGVAAGVAAVALASSYLYARQSWCCEATAPALAGSLLGIAAALESAARRSPVWAGLGGLAFAIGVMSKLLVVPLLGVAAVALALRWEDDRWRLRVDGRTCWAAAAAVCGFVAGVVALAISHPISDLYDQAVRLHFVKSGNYDRAANLSFLAHDTVRDIGTVGLAAIGFMSLPRRGRVVLLGWLLFWLAIAAAFLLSHRPLHPHHVVLMAPLVAIAAGVGASALARRRSGWLFAVLAAVPLYCVDRGVPGLAIGGNFTLTLSPIRNHERLVNRPLAPDEAAVLRALSEHTRPGDLIVTDDPKLAYWADRGVPALLCDPSIERIEAGYLSLETAVRAAGPARAVVFWRRWLQRIPGFAAWVREHFHPVLVIDDQRAVYLANRVTE